MLAVSQSPVSGRGAGLVPEWTQVGGTEPGARSEPPAVCLIPGHIVSVSGRGGKNIQRGKTFSPNSGVGKTGRFRTAHTKDERSECET